ncbi:MAG: sugar phosphate isomerase/epimerase family protein [Bacteroidia bacterium]
MNRRNFIRKSGGLALGAGLFTGLSGCSNLLTEKAAMTLPIDKGEGMFFNISLAQWSLHSSYWAGKRDPLDFAKAAKEEFGLSAIEYVNQFFSDKASDRKYLAQLKQRADDHGVKSVLIMIDAEGNMGTLDEKERHQVVENHKPWVEAAKQLGCHAIRVNAGGKGQPQIVKNAVVDSLSQLSEFAAQDGINIIVENHGGYSSDGAWLADVMQTVNLSNCGTLPDFGNFLINGFPYKRYDKYQGVKELMLFAKGVSAKTHSFTPEGEESDIDFRRMLGIIKDSGFDGHIGIEYEGYKLSEEAGIRATIHLLQKSAQAI